MKRKSALPTSTPGNKQRARHWTGRQRGTELVEAAFVVTLLLTFLIGIFWIARGFNTYQTLRRAAREGARFAVAPNCAMCGNTYPTDADVRGVIAAALQADNLNPLAVTPDPIPILRDQPLNADEGSAIPATGVVIEFGYPFDLYLPFTPVGLTSFTLNVRVQMREER